MYVDIFIYRARIGLFIAVTCKLKGSSCFSEFDCLIWLALVLLQCGDIEKNPGPEPTSCFKDSRQNLSIVHYNVQSFYNKRDILFAELHDFDIVSFT